MDTLLDSLQRQQAQIEDKKAFADMVMERIEGEEDYVPRHDCGTPLRTYPGLTANIHWMFASPLKRGWLPPRPLLRGVPRQRRGMSQKPSPSHHITVPSPPPA